MYCYNRWLAVASLAGLLACSPMGRAGQGMQGKGRPSAKGIEEFVLAQGGRQLFMLPVAYTTAGPAKLKADYTYRDSAQRPRSATLRVTVRARRSYEVIDSAWALVGNERMDLGTAKALFTEAHGKEVHTRLEFNLDGAAARNLMATAPPTLVLKAHGQAWVFTPTKKARKRLAGLAFYMAQ